MSWLPRNRILFLLMLAAIAACAFLGFVTQAPNRLTSGEARVLIGVAATPELLGLTALAAALLVMSFVGSSRLDQYVSLGIAAVLLLALCFEAGRAGDLLMADAPRATRIGLGAAFWIALFCLVMAMVDALQRLRAGPALRLLVALVVIAGLAAMAAAGLFDSLSLMREYAARRSVFAAELDRHAALVFGAVAIALVIGMPLGLLAARRPRADGTIFAILNILQTIPSIALFALLILPLSALAAAVPALARAGIGGIGAAPAIVALVLYALLPIVRNTQAGIAGVDRAVTEAARGMGLTAAQIFWRVELPLGAPVFLAGLRIVTVQTIGLAAVAALIGAGGLGSFIFQGIGQYATDLVLLGALPIILFALAADFLLSLAISALQRKQAS